MTTYKDAKQKTKPTTGRVTSAKQKVQRKVSNLIKNGSAFYIGKTSGPDGLKNRWNEKYKKEGMMHISPVYQTTCNEYANEIERYLIEYFKKRTECQNKVAGGGGNTNEQEQQFVYVAWK